MTSFNKSRIRLLSRAHEIVIFNSEQYIYFWFKYEAINLEKNTDLSFILIPNTSLVFYFHDTEETKNKADYLSCIHNIIISHNNSYSNLAVMAVAMLFIFYVHSFMYFFSMEQKSLSLTQKTSNFIYYKAFDILVLTKRL